MVLIEIEKCIRRIGVIRVTPEFHQESKELSLVDGIDVLAVHYPHGLNCIYYLATSYMFNQQDNHKKYNDPQDWKRLPLYSIQLLQSNMNYPPTVTVNGTTASGCWEFV